MKFPLVLLRRKRYDALMEELERLRKVGTTLDIRRDRFEKRMEAVARSVLLEGVR